MGFQRFVPSLFEASVHIDRKHEKINYTCSFVLFFQIEEEILLIDLVTWNQIQEVRIIVYTSILQYLRRNSKNSKNVLSTVQSTDFFFYDFSTSPVKFFLRISSRWHCKLLYGGLPGRAQVVLWLP